MRHLDQRIYRTFEEFEREELRRIESVGTSVADMMALFSEDEIEAARGARRRAASRWDDDE
jgi:hypothetical protein